MCLGHRCLQRTKKWDDIRSQQYEWLGTTVGLPSIDDLNSLVYVLYDDDRKDGAEYLQKIMHVHVE